MIEEEGEEVEKGVEEGEEVEKRVEDNERDGLDSLWEVEDLKCGVGEKNGEERTKSAAHLGSGEEDSGLGLVDKVKVVVVVAGCCDCLGRRDWGMSSPVLITQSRLPSSSRSSMFNVMLYPPTELSLPRGGASSPFSGLIM